MGILTGKLGAALPASRRVARFQSGAVRMQAGCRNSNLTLTMKDALLILFRHTFAAIAAMLVHHGITADAGSTVSMLAGVLVFGFVTLLSAVLKMDIDDDKRAALQKLAAALASQFVAALAGWLQADAATAADPAALSLFLGNMTLSKLRGHVPPARVLGLLALCSLPFALSSCSSPSQEALKSRLEAAFVSAGREVSAVALQSTITTLKHELALLEAKPVDEDPMQQLLDQNRMQAIRAAIRLGEERLAKLRSSKAVIEVNAVSRVTIPIFAPQVIAALQTR